jgi:hypothetical protein
MPATFVLRQKSVKLILLPKFLAIVVSLKDTSATSCQVVLVV